MLRALQFNISVPTPYVFLNRFLKEAQADKQVCKPHVIHVYKVLPTPKSLPIQTLALACMRLG